jgi:murein DD-endopeptidase / murein LD-carboxypeptidase
MASVLLGTALLLLTGCQSAPRANSPPRTTALTAQPRKAIIPSAWKAEANRWVGVKYRKGGLDRAGIDSSGLTSRMYLAVAGKALPATIQDQSRCGNFVSRNDLQPGDLIFFISLSERMLDHVGIYLGDKQFVHASPSKGVVVSSLLQDYYMERYHSARRIVP